MSKTNIDPRLFKWSSHLNDQCFSNIPPIYFSVFYAKRVLRSHMTRNIQFWTELKTYFPNTQTSNSVHLLLLLSLFYFFVRHYYKVQVSYTFNMLNITSKFCTVAVFVTFDLKTVGVASSTDVRGEQPH